MKDFDMSGIRTCNPLLFFVVQFNIMNKSSRVDPLTSILAVLARSCQILTTSWQPWIPWQDSY